MSSSSDQEDFQQDDSSEEEEVLSGEAGGVDEDTEDEGESEAGVSEAEDSDGENNSEAKQPALDASSTESDEDEDGDDEVGDDEDIPQKKSAAQRPPPKLERYTQELQEKYEKRQGKQLFVRFPEKLPGDQEEFDKKVKAISELIVTAIKPRQKYARFCLVEFATTEDRDATMKKLKKHKAENKLEVSLPKTESKDDFIKSLTEMKRKKIEKKRAKQLLKKEKKALHGKSYTSNIVVLNIPKTASTAQIKELFPNAVDIQTKPAPSRFDGFSIATITLPTTLEATKNCKRNLSLGGTKLIIRFDNEKKKDQIKNRKAKKNKQQTEEKKGPVASTPLVTNGNNQQTQKKGNKANKVKAPKDEVASPSKQKLPLSKKRELKDDESKVPNKKMKLIKTPQKSTVEDKDPVAPKKEKKNSKFPQNEGNAPPNKKVQGKKPNKQFKQKAKPQKKAKLAAN